MNLSPDTCGALTMVFVVSSLILFQQKCWPLASVYLLVGVACGAATVLS